MLGGFSTHHFLRRHSLVERATEFSCKIAEYHVELFGTGDRRDHGQVAATLGEHRAQTFARFEDPLDEHHVFVFHAQTADDHRVVDQLSKLHLGACDLAQVQLRDARCMLGHR